MVVVVLLGERWRRKLVLGQEHCLTSYLISSFGLERTTPGGILLSVPVRLSASGAPASSHIAYSDP